VDFNAAVTGLKEPLAIGDTSIAEDDDDWVNFNQEEKARSTSPPCPTTPIRIADGLEDTPKMSNLGLETKLPRPLSATNLADLHGIDEANSFREELPPSKIDAPLEEDTHEAEDIPAPRPDPPSDAVPSDTSTATEANNISNDGFDLSFQTGFGFDKATARASVPTETAKSVVSARSFEEEDPEVSVFEFGPVAETNWESFGDSNDIGAEAYRQKAREDAEISPQKVSAFPTF